MPESSLTLGGWVVVRQLGQGGQGTVYLVRSETRTRERERALEEIGAGLRRGGAYSSQEDRQAHPTRFMESLLAYGRDDSPSELGAAKVYKIPDGSFADKAVGRLKIELDVLSKVTSPHILRVLHTDLAARLIVSEYHASGTIADDPTRFKGRPLDALVAFRGIVEAVAELHAGGIIHRDIKPVNVFVAGDGHLVLGDFGIVFVESGNADRLTESFERVGTRDWMPPWAHTGTRIDEVSPSFDVFSLGKLLWAMVSGRAMLPFWYWNREPYDLERLFPDLQGIGVINETVIRSCVVEHEEECLQSASKLLERVDDALKILRRNGDLVRDKTMPCRICGRGVYKLMWEAGNRMLPVPPRESEGQVRIANFVDLLGKRSSVTVRVATCEWCGHLALFHFPEGKSPAAWGG